MSNVSLLHEAPLEVLRDAPETVLELMRHARVGGELPADLKVTVIDSALTEAVPSARHADLVLQLHDGAGRVAHVVVVESQRDRDPEKLAAWPLYIAYLHARHRVPVSLLVLAFDDEVAAWARQTRPVGYNLVLAPFVIGQADLPLIGSERTIRAHPAMSMLVALARLGSAEVAERHAEEVARVLQAMLGRRDRRAKQLYLPLLRGLAHGELKAKLRALLEGHGMGRVVEMIFENERAEGKAEGEAEFVLRALRRRGIPVDAGAEARIRSTRDLDVLARWFDRALEATTLDEVLAG